MVAAKAAKATRTQAATGKGTKKAAPADNESADVVETQHNDYQPEAFESNGVVPEPEPEQPEPIKHFGPPPGMYPDDAQLYSYTSKTTGQTIYFPMDFDRPKFSQVWETYDKPFTIQTWEYMRWAKIPKPMQRMAVAIYDVAPDEYLDLFNGWLSAIGGVTLGE